MDVIPYPTNTTGKQPDDAAGTQGWRRQWTAETRERDAAETRLDTSQKSVTVRHVLETGHGETRPRMRTQRDVSEIGHGKTELCTPPSHTNTHRPWNVCLRSAPIQLNLHHSFSQSSPHHRPHSVLLRVVPLFVQR